MHRRSGSLSHRVALATALCVAAPLCAPALASADLGDKTLRPGDTGGDVRDLQRELNDAGYKTARDGEFGANTLKRVRAFEGNEQLKVDGKVTPADAKVLEGTTKRGKNGEKAFPSGGASPDDQDVGTTPPAKDDPADAPVSGETTPGATATLGSDGFAVAPASAPAEVKQAIAAGNEIAKAPYVYGGGHGTKLKASGYDCSGSISFALRKAGLLKSSLASGPMTKFGQSGEGEWITLYANSGHAYMIIAGLRFDTSARKRDGTRWAVKPRTASGYTARHPAGF